MRTISIKIIISALILVGIGFLFGSTSSYFVSEALGKKKVEYKIYSISGGSLKQAESEFNQLAAEGWEIVEWGMQPNALLKR